MSQDSEEQVRAVADHGDVTRFSLGEWTPVHRRREGPWHIASPGFRLASEERPMIEVIRARIRGDAGVRRENERCDRFVASLDELAGGRGPLRLFYLQRGDEVLSAGRGR